MESSSSYQCKCGRKYKQSPVYVTQTVTQSDTLQQRQQQQQQQQQFQAAIVIRVLVSFLDAGGVLTAAQRSDLRAQLLTAN